MTRRLASGSDVKFKIFLNRIMVPFCLTGEIAPPPRGYIIEPLLVCLSVLGTDNNIAIVNQSSSCVVVRRLFITFLAFSFHEKLKAITRLLTSEKNTITRRVFFYFYELVIIPIQTLQEREASSRKKYVLGRMAPKSGNESAKQSEFNSFLKKSDDDESSDPLSSSSHPSFSRPPNPYPESSFLSKMFFIWPQQLLKEGSLKPIEEKDLPTIMKKEESRHNREIFETIWQNEIDRVESAKKRLPEGSKKRENLRPSLGRALTIDFLKSTWIIQPCMFASSCARVSMSVALGYLIQTFIDKSKDGYYWAIVVIVSNAIVLFEHHHVFFITWRKGMQYRIGAVSSVFSKSLRYVCMCSRRDVIL